VLQGYPLLRDFLCDGGIRHVIMLGYAADMCLISTTAGYENISKDFNCFVVGDATLATFPANDTPAFATVWRCSDFCYYCSSTVVDQREADDAFLIWLLTIGSVCCCTSMLTCSFAARGCTECGDFVCEFATADHGVLMDQTRTARCQEHAKEE